MLGAADLAHATAVRIDAPRDAILVLAAILEPAAASVVAEMKRIVGSLHVEMEGRAPGTFPEVTCTRGRVWQVGNLHASTRILQVYTKAWQLSSVHRPVLPGRRPVGPAARDTAVPC